MAITLPLTSKFGFDLPAAYVRFEKTPRFDTAAGTATIGIEVFASAAAKTAGRPPVPGFGFVPVTVAASPASDTPNDVLAAAYTALKARPEFADAEDA